MSSENRLQWLLMVATNLYLFFLCSTKWNAGYSISGGILGILILWLYFVKRKKAVCAFKLFFAVYGIFMGGVLLASYLTGDGPSIHVAYKFISYSLPMWLLYLVLQQADSIYSATLKGVVAGSWVLIAESVRELYSSPWGERLNGSFASANNFAMVLEAILPFLWIQVWELPKKRKNIFFWILLFTASMLSLCLILSASRGGIAGFLLGLIGTGIISYFQNKKWSLKKNLGIFILVGCLAGTGIFGTILRFQHRSYDSERILLWKAAYAMWQDHKLYGVGFQRWNTVYRAGYISTAAREPNLTLAHNNLANFFSATGIFGGVGYLIFTFGSFALIVLRLHQNPKDIYMQIMFWIWIAITIHGFVDNSLYAKFNTRLYFAMWGVSLADIAKAGRKNHKGEKIYSLCD